MKMKNRTIQLVALCLGLLSGQAYAATVYVPTDYATLGEAIAAAGGSVNIRLAESYEDESAFWVVQEGLWVLIDLNGHTLTLGDVLTNRGNLTVTDTASGGTLKCQSAYGDHCGIINEGSFTLTGGKLTANDSSISVILSNSGVVSIAGGEISTSESNISLIESTGGSVRVYSSSSSSLGRNGAGAGVQIDSGTFYLNNGSVECELTLEGNSTFNLGGGSFKGQLYSDPASVIKVFNCYETDEYYATITAEMTGGEVNGTVTIDDPYTLTVTGGSFAVNPTTIERLTILEGYRSRQSGSRWVVERIPNAVKITSGLGVGEYQSLTAALAAIAGNAETTISLVEGVSEDVTIPSGRNIVLDLNGCTLTGSVTNHGTLRIRDDAAYGRGKIVKSGTVALQNDGTLEICGGTIEGANSVRNDGGTVTISGGTFNAPFYGSTTTGYRVTGGVFSFDPSSPNNYVAEGYEATANNDNTWTVAAEPPKFVKIGTKKYVSFADALATVVAGEPTTLELIADTSETVTIGATQNIILDFKGFTLTGGRLTNNGALTITDSTAYTQDDGTYVSGSLSNGSGAIATYGTLTIVGGCVEAANGTAILAGATGDLSSQKVSVTGGVVKGIRGISISQGALDISGGLVHGTKSSLSYGVYASNGVTVTIRDNAKLVCGCQALYVGTGVQATITGGFIEGVQYGIYRANGTVQMTAGTVQGALYGEAAGYAITGGTFSNDPTAQLASTYMATLQGTNPETWVVGVKTIFTVTVLQTRLGERLVGSTVQTDAEGQGNVTLVAAEPAEGEVFVAWKVGSETRVGTTLDLTGLTEDTTIEAIYLPAAIMTGIVESEVDAELEKAVQEVLEFGDIAFKIEEDADEQKSYAKLGLEIRKTTDLKGEETQWDALTNIEVKVELNLGTKGFYKFIVPKPTL